MLAVGVDVDGPRYRKSGESDLRFMIEGLKGYFDMIS